MKTVTAEQCQRLVALGFDGEGVVTCTDEATDEVDLLLKPMDFPHALPAPFHERVFEWARDKEKIHVEVYPQVNMNSESGLTWGYSLHHLETGRNHVDGIPVFATYRKAQEAALEQLLQLLERKKGGEEPR